MIAIRHVLDGGKDLLALQVFPPYPVKKEGITAVFDIIQDCFRSHGSLLVFQEPCKRGCRKGGAHVGNHIGDDALQQVYIPDFVPLHNILELNGVKKVLQVLL